MLVVYPSIPENAFFSLTFQISFTYAILIFCIHFYLLYALFSYTKNPKNTFLHIIHILSCYLQLYLEILFSVFTSRILRLQTPSPYGIDIFISKLATSDLCTCSHQVVF